ncbi:MAG: outer membrane protein assembly factor BamD, partial [Bacteroidota bacterium]
MKKLALCLAALFFVIASECFGQQLSYNIAIEQQEDPGYKLYKEGYNLILQSNWRDAQKKFEEVLKLYRNSSYYDDANYWYAYALKYQDEKKAIDALKKFLKGFPKSSYRSDALEDLAELKARFQGNIVLSPDSLHRPTFNVRVPNIQVEVPDIRIYQNWDVDFPPGDQMVVSVFSDEMQDEMEWGLVQPWFPSRSKDLDENTRLKISALRGIAAERDSESFRTVRDILL